MSQTILVDTSRARQQHSSLMGEISPLLVDADSMSESSLHHRPSSHCRTLAAGAAVGQATFVDTILNLMKSCLGTGCLALPFACQQGGILTFLVGSFAIAAWNVYSVERLCRCLEYLPKATDNSATFPSIDINTNHPQRRIQQQQLTTQHHPPEGTTTLGVVSFYAFGGTVGLHCLDVLLLTFFLGVLVAYVAALINFLGDTPLRFLGGLGNATLAGTVMAFVSLVPDLGYLSRASAVGLGVLLATFVVIAACGLLTNTTTFEDEMTELHWKPESLLGLSHWFGIVVLGYGVVPLTYNFRESMAEPTQLVAATGWALSGVALSNVVLGVGLYCLFPNVQGEILHELGPGFVPMLTRFAMVWVVLLTTPLLIVPCSEMIEGKLGLLHHRHQQQLHDDDDDDDDDDVTLSSSTTRLRDLVRCAIVATAVAFAVLVPSFVNVFSFVGCVCGGLLGLCLPPALYLRLARPERYATDGLLFLAGVVTTIASTVYSFGNIL